MIVKILYITAGLALGILLLTYGANNVSRPSNLSVLVGVAEIILAFIVLIMIVRYFINQLKLNK